jgi:hypothetical protein
VNTVSKTVLALDPGEDTGIAVWWGEDNLHASFELPYKEVGPWLESFLMLARPDIIVYERFDVTMETVKKNAPDTSTRVIGILDFLAAKYELRDPIPQQRAKRTILNDARLKHLGWYTTEGDGHNNDASRHLGAYLLDKKLIDGKGLADL